MHVRMAEGTEGGSGGAAADAGKSGQAPAAAQAQPAAPDVAALAKRLEVLEAENKSLRDENAAKRVKAKEAEERAANEAKALAEKNGEWSKVLDAERGEKKKLADELAALGPKATRAERLETILKNEVESLEKQLGADIAKDAAHLPLEDRLPILKRFAAMATGPGAAKSSTNAPPAGHTVQIDVSKMNEAEAAAHFAGKTPEQIKAELGIKKSSSWFGR